MTAAGARDAFLAFFLRKSNVVRLTTRAWTRGRRASSAFRNTSSTRLVHYWRRSKTAPAQSPARPPFHRTHPDIPGRGAEPSSIPVSPSPAKSYSPKRRCAGNWTAQSSVPAPTDTTLQPPSRVDFAHHYSGGRLHFCQRAIERYCRLIRREGNLNDRRVVIRG